MSIKIVVVLNICYSITQPGFDHAAIKSSELLQKGLTLMSVNKA